MNRIIPAPLAPYVDIHPEVREALENKRPVVALESTIISHGMAYPENVETARDVEAIVRDQGATPATIAIVEGRLRVGVGPRELEILGSSRDVRKVSRRDIPLAVARGGVGGTTVSATMYVASLAGIALFVTGGIGGVHRGAQESFDISADLTELGRTSVAVVCAGAKAILDLPLTLEWLETQGVPIVGYGTEEFPSFYSRSSGLKVDEAVETPEEVARIMKAKWDLGLVGGVVVANPVPEADEFPRDEMETFIEAALGEARRKEVRGKALTPFLLDRLYRATGGRSLKTNIALVKNNALVGARIAVAYNDLLA